ncbi:unnamed protein product [Schistocephalus solidus]|uniref:Secreted protein n=1 Tax=Schistocephalus solidus TaxID=70667 RepID=A0A183SJ76_SCHSO|nr:unnamed protein product [Schistocephalus solidus]
MGLLGPIAHPRSRNAPRCQHILRTHHHFSQSSHVRNYQYQKHNSSALRTSRPILIIVTTHARNALALSATCESIAQKLANQPQEHQHTTITPDSTVRTAHAHSRTTRTYWATCVFIKTCGRTPQALPTYYIDPHQPMHFK